MLKTIFAVVCCTLFMTAAHANPEMKQRAQESKKVVKEFMGQLKGELKAAMKAGGPINAVEVCNKKAPGIAQGLSDKYGWEISRTSLKTRNANNKPDAWELKVLKEFEARKAKGEAVQPMAHFEAVEQDGAKTFRFMKAIPTGDICLKCHGDDINPDLKAKIDEKYPEDMATGFKLGDIRGAFSITRPW